ncbi:MAG: DUF502 domain-containing protein [Acidobacteria bacterium]|nr:DUF502 domain-containing protein [Acidobacteriota bacterium]
MQKIKKFFKTTMLGGVVVLLPVFLTIFFLKWLFNFITHLLNPVTKLICREAAIQQRLADLLVITIIIIYNLFRNTIKQFFGQEKNPFSRVVLVQAFGSESSSLMTGFITDEQPTDDGRYTVFLPSALNPTTGLILHVEKKYVQIIPVSVETAMRSIISCGAGSAELLDMAPNILSK